MIKFSTRGKFYTFSVGLAELFDGFVSVASLGFLYSSVSFKVSAILTKRWLEAQIKKERAK